MNEVKVIEAEKLPAATPISTRRIKLGKGPERAYPIEEPQFLPDRSISQRFQTNMGQVLRRRLSVKDEQELRQVLLPGRPSPVWWECELGGSITL